MSLKFYITYWRVYFKALLMSSMHHLEERDGETKNPELVTFYSNTKGNVNPLDQIQYVHGIHPTEEVSDGHSPCFVQ